MRLHRGETREQALGRHGIDEWRKAQNELNELKRIAIAMFVLSSLKKHGLRLFGETDHCRSTCGLSHEEELELFK
jgi:hypothetical protein